MAVAVKTKSMVAGLALVLGLSFAIFLIAEEPAEAGWSCTHSYEWHYHYFPAWTYHESNFVSHWWSGGNHYHRLRYVVIAQGGFDAYGYDNIRCPNHSGMYYGAG